MSVLIAVIVGWVALQIVLLPLINQIVEDFIEAPRR